MYLSFPEHGAPGMTCRNAEVQRMYGIVLMAALSTGSGTPSADATPPVVVAPMMAMPSTGCFSSGCGGGVMMSAGCYSTGCCGGSYSGCYSSCNGCGGGGFLGLRSRMAGLFASRRSSCSGCYGSSCYGSSCYGSSCYGSSCFGSSCYGGGAHYYGSDFHGGSTTGAFYGSANIPDAVPYVSIPMEFKSARTKSDAAPARLTVEVPAEAKLYVDGQLTRGEGSTRNFHTPDLTDGQTFFYDLKAEVTVEGIPLIETKRVIVRSGEALSESFPKLIAAVKDGKHPTLLATKSR